MARSVLSILLLSYILAGCDQPGADASAQLGDVVVEVPAAGPLRLSAERIVTLGSISGSADSITFGSVRSVELDSDGTVYVLDSQQSQILTFSPHGELRARIGGRGEGPGELSAGATGIALDPEGGVWVADRLNRRYSHLSDTGEVLGTYSREFRGSWSFEWDGQFDREGQLWESTSITTAEVGESMPVRLRLVPDETRGMVSVDTVPRPVSLPRECWEVGYVSTGSGVAEGGCWPFPLQPEIRGDFSPLGGYWTGSTAESVFYLQGPVGDTVRTIRRPGLQPARVTDADREDVLEEVRSRFGEATTVDLNLFPDSKPVWTSMFVDDVGRIWFSRPTDGSGSGMSRWEIIDPDGTLVGTLELPLTTRPRPSVRGNRIAGVVQTEFDVPLVVVFRVQGLQE